MFKFTAIFIRIIQMEVYTALFSLRWLQFFAATVCGIAFIRLYDGLHELPVRVVCFELLTKKTCFSLYKI